MSKTDNLGLEIPSAADKHIFSTYKDNNEIIDEAYGQYLEDQETSQENIAMIESHTAQSNHAIGSYFMLDNVLHKATSAIASGETITSGSNATPITLEQALTALNSSVSTLQDEITVKNITPSYTVISDVNVRSFGVYRFGKIVFVVFYFDLSASKSNNTALLTANKAFPRPIYYGAQAVVSSININPSGVLGIYRENFWVDKITASGNIQSGTYQIAQFCYITDE